MKRRKKWETKQKCRKEKEQYNTRTPCIHFVFAEDYNQTEQTSFVLYGEARTAFHENDNTNSNRKDEQEKEERKMEI